MATSKILMGPIPHARYDWISGASYGKEAIVFHKGSSYIALSDNPSTEPSFTYDPATGSYNVSAGWGLLAVGAEIVQETGDSQDKAMSQKAVTDALTASDQKLSELEKELKGNIVFSLIENKYIKVDGTVSDYTGWAMSDYIPCSGIKSVIIKNDGVWSKYNHFYDADKKPIGTNFQVERETIVDVIDGASFFVLSNTIASMKNTTISVGSSMAEQIDNNKKGIALLEKRIDEMSEKATIQFVNNAKGAKAFPESLSIGDVAELQDYSYVMTSEALTNNAIGVWVCCKTNNGVLGAVVVDEANVVIDKISIEPNAKEIMRYIALPDSSYKIYWTETYNDNLSSIIYFDYDKSNHKIYEGNNIPCSINGSHYNDVYATDGNEISIKFEQCLARSCGIYLKVNSKNESDKIDKVIMSLYNQGVQIGSESPMDATLVNCNEWSFIKMMPSAANHNTQYVDEIRISVIPKGDFSGDSIKMQFKDKVVVNKFDRPILVINFDDVWEGSENSGAYDYLLNNNIPFSITGKFQENTSLSASMNEKLVNAYKCGLLDVGLYGNESGGVVVGDSTTYQELIRRIEQSIEIKRSHGFDCVSFGSGNHYTSNAMVRALSSCGFKAIRLGAPQGMCVVESMLDNGLFMSPTYNNNYACIGGMAGYFSHGVFINPTSSLHDTFSNFISVVSYALEECLKGGLWIMNMKQYCEMKNTEK